MKDDLAHFADITNVQENENSDGVPAAIFPVIFPEGILDHENRKRDRGDEEDVHDALNSFLLSQVALHREAFNERRAAPYLASRKSSLSVGKTESTVAKIKKALQDSSAKLENSIWSLPETLSQRASSQPTAPSQRADSQPATLPQRESSRPTTLFFDSGYPERKRSRANFGSQSSYDGLIEKTALPVCTI